MYMYIVLVVVLVAVVVVPLVYMLLFVDYWRKYAHVYSCCCCCCCRCCRLCVHVVVCLLVVLLVAVMKCRPIANYFLLFFCSCWCDLFSLLLLEPHSREKWLQTSYSICLLIVARSCKPTKKKCANHTPTAKDVDDVHDNTKLDNDNDVAYTSNVQWGTSRIYKIHTSTNFFCSSLVQTFHT